MNKSLWTEAIKTPTWYLTLRPEFERLAKLMEDEKLRTEIKEEIYQFFEDHLENNSIVLGSSGPNWDADRKPVDTIVIHHTKNQSGMTKQRLSAMHLFRLYAAYYASPSTEELEIKGQPIYSNHFKENKQVFYAYHWLVRMDGTTEKIIE